MKFKLLNPIYLTAEIGRRLYIKTLNCADVCAQDSRQRKLMLLSGSLTFGTVMFSSSANAQEGFAGMFKTGASQATSMKESGAKILGAGGVGAAGYGVVNWVKKGKEGENSRITLGQVVVPLVAGAAMGAISAVMIKAGETVGLQASDQGQIY